MIIKIKQNNINKYDNLLNIKSTINSKNIEKYDVSFLNKIKYILSLLYESYNNILDQLGYLLNFQEEIIENYESIQKIILNYNKKWISTFMP